MLDYAVVASAKKRAAGSGSGISQGLRRSAGAGGSGTRSGRRTSVGSEMGQRSTLELGAMEKRQKELLERVDGLASKYRDLFSLAQETA
jgi:hypothetical protein